MQKKKAKLDRFQVFTVDGWASFKLKVLKGKIRDGA